jgi:uncharacterized protein YecE (DUF72 family)
MSKIIKLTETDLSHLVKKILKEQKNERYMFFSNLQQIRRQMDILLDMNPQMIEDVLEDGHDWAQDHIATAKESIDQVFDFFMNKEKEDDVVIVDSEMSEGKKKKNVATNQKLWKQSLAWAKTKYDVCPSAYCNGAAVKRYNSKGGKWKKE